ncbi:MAG: deoxyribodipyrimidine photo-lyase [Proteobacteria bacterium]|nr:deoxyribodipyrimidine photo-lyase [Pseudomonadota bacterium]
MTTLIWFRNDLRLFANYALVEASQNQNVIGVYVIDKEMGGAQKWWLHHSLIALQKDLKDHGIPLLVTMDPILKIIDDYAIQKVYWNRCYDPESISRDTSLKQTLKAKGIDVLSYNSSLLIEPFQIQNKQSSPYKVFTPFWKKIKDEIISQQLLKPAVVPPPLMSIPFDIDAFNLLPNKPNWAKDFTFKPGEESAQLSMVSFLKEKVEFYEDVRNIPSQKGTSSLSPHIHFGEISVHQIFQNVDPFSQFAQELGWREFAYYLIYHFPYLLKDPLNQRFKNFPWMDDDTSFKKWTMGLTGYPIVDAGMRQLWQTGWMHNRVRMIVASFLTKHLLIPWQKGAAWFLDTLLDADIAINTISWQWVAGCGPDAAPYFRIFNPTAQGEKFDPEGIYIKQWVPELRNIPQKFIHTPWLSAQNSDYPKPIVNHDFARKRALEIYQKLD